MSVYAQVADVKAVLEGQTGDVPGSAAELSEPKIQSALDNAEEQVNINLRSRYIVPLNPVPPLVKFITRDIAVQLADWTYRMSREYGAGDNPIRLRYDRAVQLLQDIRMGILSLDVPETNISSGFAEAINPYDGDLITVEHLFEWPRYG